MARIVFGIIVPFLVWPVCSHLYTYLLLVLPVIGCLTRVGKGMYSNSCSRNSPKSLENFDYRLPESLKYAIL